MKIEMQVARESIEKRIRYYHSQMDLDILESGTRYEYLPDAYVIFICDFDPFGFDRYVYSVDEVLSQVPSYHLDTGSHTIFLNTKGKNRDEISDKLYAFLEFLRRDQESLMDEVSDDFVLRLQKTITEIRRNLDWGDRFMLLEELLERERLAAKEEWREIGREEGRAEGRAEGKAEGKIEGKAEIVAKLRNTLSNIVVSRPDSKDLLEMIDRINDEDELLKLFMQVSK